MKFTSIDHGQPWTTMAKNYGAIQQNMVKNRELR